jgi:hypothetical protein
MSSKLIPNGKMKMMGISNHGKRSTDPSDLKYERKKLTQDNY